VILFLLLSRAHDLCGVSRIKWKGFSHHGWEVSVIQSISFNNACLFLKPPSSLQVE